MIILTIRTDRPEAELGLYDNATQLGYESWSAHRQLSETIFTKIEALLSTHGKKWEDINAVACFKGPGSFTGLRIGVAVANALSGSLSIPIVGEQGEAWLETACTRLIKGENETIVVPDYGRDAHITQPRK